MHSQDLRLDCHVYVPLRKNMFQFLRFLSSHLAACEMAVRLVERVGRQKQKTILNTNSYYILNGHWSPVL